MFSHVWTLCECACVCLCVFMLSVMAGELGGFDGLYCTDRTDFNEIILEFTIFRGIFFITWPFLMVMEKHHATVLMFKSEDNGIQCHEVFTLLFVPILLLLLFFSLFCSLHCFSFINVPNWRSNLFHSTLICNSDSLSC